METPDTTSLAGRNDRIATSVARVIFLFAMLGVLAGVSLRGQWEAHLRVNDAETLISHLPRQPIWQPPPAPAYEHFKKVFDRLPTAKPDTSTIVVLIRWDRVAMELFFWLWVVTSLVGILYLMTRGKYVDVLLHYVLSVAIGLTIGACACIAVWLVFGGWGPPVPLFFASCGLILGLAIGLTRLRRLSTCRKPG